MAGTSGHDWRDECKRGGHQQHKDGTKTGLFRSPLSEPTSRAHIGNCVPRALRCRIAQVSRRTRAHLVPRPPVVGKALRCERRGAGTSRKHETPQGCAPRTWVVFGKREAPPRRTTGCANPLAPGGDLPRGVAIGYARTPPVCRTRVGAWRGTPLARSATVPTDPPFPNAAPSVSCVSCSRSV